MVAVHNDYILRNERYTFWLFTKNVHGVTLAVKGEGSSDEEALDKARNEIRGLGTKLEMLTRKLLQDVISLREVVA